jgi:hypothetical protein
LGPFSLFSGYIKNSSSFFQDLKPFQATAKSKLPFFEICDACEEVIEKHLSQGTAFVDQILIEYKENQKKEPYVDWVLCFLIFIAYLLIILPNTLSCFM